MNADDVRELQDLHMHAVTAGAYQRFAARYPVAVEQLETFGAASRRLQTLHTSIRAVPKTPSGKEGAVARTVVFKTAPMRA